MMMNEPTRPMADTIISESPDETRQIAERLAERLEPGDVLTLTGDLGAGKTHFVQGLAHGLGFPGEVSSPTFAIIQEYHGGRLPLFHIDFYRLETLEEVEALGIEEEYLQTRGITAIEWAEKFPQILPVNRLWKVRLTIGNGERREVGLTSP